MSSWWEEGSAEGGEQQPSLDLGGTKDAPPAQDLTGKPEWLPDSFWQAPEKEGEAADWQAMAQKMAGSLKEGRQKITEQGEKLAKLVVPEGTAPYLEGFDKDAFVKATERSGYDATAIDGAISRMRSAGIGPGPARAFLEAELKARHEATPAPKTPDVLADAAIAELNAAGRPGSEMAKRIRTWVGGMVGEEKLSQGQAEALGALMGSAAGLEAAYALIGTVPAGPAEGKGTTNSTKSIVESLDKKIEDPRFGVDPAYTMRVKKEMEANQAAVGAVYGMDVENVAA